MKNFRVFRKLCGDDTLRNVVIVTNMWGEVPVDRGEQRERELETQDDFFKPALDRGARMLRHDHGSVKSAEEIMRQVLTNTPTVLDTQRDVVDGGHEVSDTAAARELTQEITVELEKQKLNNDREKREIQGNLLA